MTSRATHTWQAATRASTRPVPTRHPGRDTRTIRTDRRQPRTHPLPQVGGEPTRTRRDLRTVTVLEMVNHRTLGAEQATTPVGAA